jgi:hypothetical protein
MRPDHTAADFSTDFSADFATDFATDFSGSGSALPLSPPVAGDGDAAPDLPRPLTRITFCFAWLFGLEPFLLGGTNEQSRSGVDRRA